jgi:uncharacterized Zn finger protein
MNNPQQPQMNIDFSQTVAEVCEECGNDTFTEVFKMRKLSALLSPTGQEALIPINLFACAKCGHVNKGFQPKGNDAI